MMVSTAVRKPVAVGAKVTATAQVPPVATIPQVLGPIKKSPAFVPVVITLLMTSGAVPQLVIITLCTKPVVPTKTVLPKLIRLPAGQTAEVRGMASPCRSTVVGLPAASCVIVRAACRVPATWGLNVTLSTQKPPGAIGPPVQLGDCTNAKSSEPAPVRETLEMFNGAEPQLVIVTLCTVLVVVTS